MGGFIRNKRGFQFLDLLLMVIILIVFGFLTVAGFKFFSTLNDDLQASDDLATQSKTMIQDNVDRYPSSFDTIFLLLFVGLVIGVCLGAYLVDIYPALFWVNLLLIAIFSIIIMVINNVWFEAMSTDEFQGVVTSFPMMVFLMDNFIWLMVIVAFVTSVLYFAKRSPG